MRFSIRLCQRIIRLIYDIFLSKINATKLHYLFYMSKKSRNKVLDLEGLKSTYLREEILSFFKKSHRPISANDVIAYLKRRKTKFNRVTVFRTLNTFEKKDLINKIEFQEGNFRYELTSLPHHHHLVCLSCGSIEDIDSCFFDSELQDIEKKVIVNQSFIINSHRLDFFGRCSKCL